jgi:hypothetical protein
MAPQATKSKPRKTTTKAARGKAPASVEDEGVPYSISLADHHTTTWMFFDNAASRRLITLFDDDTIVSTPSKEVALILRDMIPYIVRNYCHIFFVFAKATRLLFF